MRRKWILLLVTLLIGLVAFSAPGTEENEIGVTVKIRNSDCAEFNISQFLFVKDNSPLGVKRFLPPRTVSRNQVGSFSFNMDTRPTHLRLSGTQNGRDFSYTITLNWGTNEKNVSCGRITVEVPYKGGLKYPVARFNWNPQNPAIGERVRLDAGNSVGTLETYGWDFDGDGRVEEWKEGPVASYRWNQPGEYRVALRVRDRSGREAKTANTITISSTQPPKSSALPLVESFSCQEHGYFSPRRGPSTYLEDAYSPPHDRCWGHYRAHIYPLEESLGRPVALSRITAKVTGGISELGAVREGFALQVLRRSNGSWRTLKEFSAPCASGDKGTLVQWKAQGENYVEALAVRLVAPSGGDNLFVDHSAIWIEYYPLG